MGGAPPLKHAQFPLMKFLAQIAPTTTTLDAAQWDILKNYLEIHLWSMWFLIGVLFVLIVAVVFDFHKR
jgi:hypothetical protein